ncbi:hypothetical protein CEXT_603761 [Caerostris extrusa]|uniref:Uncharacterized protein n=1 Tax=Caerostris extrusa TaxID=172846 RepID=A0AAV4NT46_CAEEX|nr:hypothetical protein CEXT_603761 [Caerostris extrusa]
MNHHEDCELACIRECIQQTSQESVVACGSFLIPVGFQATFAATLRCHVPDDVLEHMDESGLPCECPFPCMSTVYDFKMSTSALDIPTTFTGSSSLGWTEDPRCDLYRDLNLGSKNLSESYPIRKEKMVRKFLRRIHELS